MGCLVERLTPDEWKLPGSRDALEEGGHAPAGPVPARGAAEAAAGRFTLRPADWLRVAMSGGVCSILSVCAAGVTSGRRGGACVALRPRGLEAAGTLHLIYSSGFSRRSAARVTSRRLFTARPEGGSAGGPRRGRGPFPPSAPPHARPQPGPAPPPLRPPHPRPAPSPTLLPAAPSPSSSPAPPPTRCPSSPSKDPTCEAPAPPGTSGHSPAHTLPIYNPPPPPFPYPFHPFPVRPMGTQPNPHTGLQPSPTPAPLGTTAGPHPPPARPWAHFQKDFLEPPARSVEVSPGDDSCHPLTPSCERGPASLHGAGRDGRPLCYWQLVCLPGHARWVAGLLGPHPGTLHLELLPPSPPRPSLRLG
ncbi:basic proline-rich protein-like [Orcinus orca]|uniref:basic proline-rich protein-like n=1 Tax=Orcinus orca TaxID=9733 RepID=UPI00144255C9|nr:basic proline-rich protein-like [Orcinus orca]XP_049552066.1 basic proline-rich protein-like [Orcinus orca]XP_049552069.1 basic proline-rich protein-like [Orcinus orca]